jgi:hypothetical protein
LSLTRKELETLFVPLFDDTIVNRLSKVSPNSAAHLDQHQEPDTPQNTSSTIGRDGHPIVSPTQEPMSTHLTISLSPITPLDTQLSSPQTTPPYFANPVPWRMLESHGDSCLCCIHNRTVIFGLRDEIQYMFSYIEHLLTNPPPTPPSSPIIPPPQFSPITPPSPSCSPN